MVAMIVMTIAGAEPAADTGRRSADGKGNAFGIYPERIVYADKEISHLRREVDRAAFGIVAGEELGFVIEDLRREDTLLEGDNLGHLVRVWAARRPAHGRRVASTAWFFRSEARGRPHDRAQEADIGGRHGTPVHRENAHGWLTTPVAGLVLHAVGIVDGCDGEFRLLTE